MFSMKYRANPLIIFWEKTGGTRFLMFMGPQNVRTEQPLCLWVLKNCLIPLIGHDRAGTPFANTVNIEV